MSRARLAPTFIGGTLRKAICMRKFILFGYCILAVMTGSVMAAQSAVDEDSMDLMKDKQKSLSSNISLNDAKAATDDANEIVDMLNDVEAFYEKKGNAADAVDWSKESKDLTATILKYVAANDFNTAAQTSVSLAKTCKSCHKIYKKD
jgi:uncharacterized protein YktA (UPF0223 family)